MDLQASNVSSSLFEMSILSNVHSSAEIKEVHERTHLLHLRIYNACTAMH